MFWQEEEDRQAKICDNVVDLMFEIRCRNLPVDHAYDLSNALLQVAPWIADEPQNGWERPDPESGQQLQLSRRTKLTIRVPRERQDAVQQALTGITLDIAGHPLTVGAAKTRLLSRQGTLFARYVVLEPGEAVDEHLFLTRAARALDAVNIRVRKALCGKTTDIGTPDGRVATRSLMLAELPADQSVHLQEVGLGPLRHMGCGIFIPHKGIAAVNKTVDDD